MTNLFKSTSGQWYIYLCDEGWTLLAGIRLSVKKRVDNFNVYLNTESSDVSVFDLIVKDVSDLLNCYQYEPGRGCVNLVTGSIEFEAECSRQWLESNITWVEL